MIKNIVYQTSNYYWQEMNKIGGVMGFLVILSRIFFSAIFIFSGFNHIFNSVSYAEYAKSKKVPVPRFSVIFSGILILLGGLSVLLGAYVEIGAWLLIVFLVPAAFIMHNYWAVDDAMARQNEQAHFWKDISMAGASFLIWYLYLMIPDIPLSLTH